MKEPVVVSGPPDFEQVFAEHASFVWRVLLRHGVAERDVEDVCQEVFMVVLEALPGFEQRSSIRTWLYAICRRVAANHRRRASTRRELPVEAPPEHSLRGERDGGSPFDSLAKREGLDLLDTLLADLPETQREVFLLYEVEELTMREVAEALECSQNTAFARLYAARRTIETRLKRLRARRVA